MKQIFLTRMQLVNFKGMRSLDINLNGETHIMGGNGTGKSTIVDAYTWCLFGKDAIGRTDSGKGSFGIKTNDAEGNVIPKLDHSVECALLVDGKAVTLKRALVEDWGTRRGESVEEMRGNTTHYYVNGTECKAGEYSQLVAEMVGDMEQFQLLSTPGHFCSLHWQKQLSHLNNIIGNVSVDEVIASNPEWSALSPMLGPLGLEGLRQHERDTATASQKEIASNNERIAELQREEYKECDFNALNAEKKMLQDELQTLYANGNESELTNAKLAMQKAEADIKAAEIAYRSQVDQETAKANAEYQQAKTDMELANKLVDDMNSSHSNLALLYKYDEAEKQKAIESKEAELEAKRKEWYATNETKMDDAPGQLMCPITNKPCDGATAISENAECHAKAVEAFNTRKADTLKRINQEGNAIKDAITSLKLDIAEIHAKLKTSEREQSESLAKATAKRDAAVARFKAARQVTPDYSGFTTSNAYLVAKAALDKAASAVALIQSATNPDAAATRASEINERVSEIDRTLALYQAYCEKMARVNELTDRNRELARTKAEAEHTMDIIKAVNEARIAEMSRRIKAKFAITDFRFVEPQLNGGYTDTCVALKDGVRYDDVNSAGKVNVGLDIINAFTDAVGVSVPIFIDNAEGVNEFIPTTAQVIKLYVTQDKELIIQ